MGVACTEVGFPFLYNKMKLLLVTLAVSVVSAGVITNAYTKKQQFYPTVVYIITSSRSMSVLYVQAFLLLWHFIKFCKIIFFGTLRAIEVEV
jgi:E3 ubiquitin-protein ligase synoviolin